MEVACRRCQAVGQPARFLVAPGLNSKGNLPSHFDPLVVARAGRARVAAAQGCEQSRRFPGDLLDRLLLDQIGADA